MRAPVLASLLLVLAPLATAQDGNPLDTGPAPAATPRVGPAWSGVYVEELRGLTVVLAPAPNKPGAFEAMILRSSQPPELFPASGTVDEAGQAFAGSFAAADKRRFDCTMTFTAADALTFTTGRTTYELVRTPGDPTATLAQLRGAIEGMVEARKKGNEAVAIAVLRTINSAQTLFREADKDNDGLLDYGTLAELAEAGLIDEQVGAGLKSGYRFECRPGDKAPEFQWMATATAVELGVSGSRNFVTNHAGVIYYSRTAAFKLGDPEARIPEGATPVGR